MFFSALKSFLLGAGKGEAAAEEEEEQEKQEWPDFDPPLDDDDKEEVATMTRNDYPCHHSKETE